MAKPASPPTARVVSQEQILALTVQADGPITRAAAREVAEAWLQPDPRELEFDESVRHTETTIVVFFKRT